MLAAADEVVDAFAGAFGNGLDGDAFAAGRLCSAAVEGGGNVLDPLLLFGAIGEDQADFISSGWRSGGNL
jgi:hypothetical protein